MHGDIERRLYAEAYHEAAIDRVVNFHFKELINGLNDPEQRLIAFNNALVEGMPPVEAAQYFLELDKDAFEQLLEDYPDIRRMVNRMVANIAKAQYRKVTQADGYQAAIRWLEQNRPTEWGQKQKVDVTSNGETLKLTDDERAARIAEILDAARARGAG